MKLTVFNPWLLAIDLCLDIGHPSKITQFPFD